MIKVVVFEALTARVKWNPENLDHYKIRHDCLIDPDITHVETHPMEFWKKDGDKIALMTPEEQAVRIKEINSRVVNLKIPLDKQTFEYKYYDACVDRELHRHKFRVVSRMARWVIPMAYITGVLCGYALWH